ncbi:MAG TPA: PhoD-like phosphatase [Trichocoleus sp.]
MPWTPLRHRLPSLPLILAGPILRRTEAREVTVWVALKQSCTVRLKVYDTIGGEGIEVDRCLLEGCRATAAIGEFLHIVAVTARSVAQFTLKPGQVYAYDLQFEPIDAANDSTAAIQTLQQALNAPALPPVSVSYFAHQLPTFSLPPDDPTHLQIVHGSCRKPHGGGWDTLPILDDLIGRHVEQPDDRPHQLFLTGDQIYGDDVADPFLFTLTDAGNTLLGWTEALPIDPVAQAARTSFTTSQVLPGQRGEIAETQGGFTAGLSGKPEQVQSHLFSLSEYCAAYLLSWSSVLWSGFPTGWERYGSDRRAKAWDRQVQQLCQFAHLLWKVRRALANVPTYMIFDDHDLTDDWCLNQAWCLRVFSKPLGRRTMQNGLLAYALFQGWGNTPGQFEAGRSGEKMLQAAAQWSISGGTDAQAWETLSHCLGFPLAEPYSGLPQFTSDGETLVLKRHPQALHWHYTIRSSCHEVIVLDTRTWRGYPPDQAPIAPPMLLSPDTFDRQIAASLEQTDRLNQTGQSQIQVTFIVAPTNLLHLGMIDYIQHQSLRRGKIFHHDVGDAWNLHQGAFGRFLTTVFERRQQVIVLSGDIHYGCAAKMRYWVRSTSNLINNAQPQVLIQLTSSAINNAEWKTQLVHTKLKSIVPERPQEWIGWNESLENFVVSIKQGWIPSKRPETWSHFHELANRHQRSLPDWYSRAEWLKRQPARTVPWGKNVSWAVPNSTSPKWMTRLKQIVSLLWHNRWLQEGKEVVGRNNLGVVKFKGFDASQRPTVQQELYWHAPWEIGQVVYSRFEADLGLPSGSSPNKSDRADELPRSPRILIDTAEEVD